MDSWLRQAQQFIELDDNPNSMIRLTIRVANHSVMLRDGVTLSPGEKFLDIHFLNERIPQSSDLRGLAWAGRFGRMLRRSFAELSAVIDADPRFQGIEAIRGRLAFSNERSRDEMRRFGAWFAFDDLETTVRSSIWERLHDGLEDIWLFALAWAYNPGSLPGRTLVRRRDDLWISRKALVSRYGSAPVQALIAPAQETATSGCARLPTAANSAPELR
jgi:hypothetical protein